jgi:hypothetical protein
MLINRGKIFPPTFSVSENEVAVFISSSWWRIYGNVWQNKPLAHLTKINGTKISLKLLSYYIITDAKKVFISFKQSQLLKIILKKSSFSLGKMRTKVYLVC